MTQINIQYFKTSFGELILGEFNKQLCMCDWRYRKRRRQIDGRLIKGIDASFVEKNNDLLDQAKSQLDEYFSYKRQHFNLPVLTVGTDFQKSVWAGLMKIPFGETSSYLSLAKSISSDKVVRAVGSAIGANALSIIIPCHRIIASNGSLGGYAGGLKTKEKLLNLENDLFN